MIGEQKRRREKRRRRRRREKRRRKMCKKDVILFGTRLTIDCYNKLSLELFWYHNSLMKV